MKHLLSLPENLVPVIHAIEGLDPADWFAASDPPGRKVGSGGGTTHLLVEGWKAGGGAHRFAEHLAGDKRILIHAGGQSRRLPGYAPSGKLLTPIPVFRWARGQRLDQNLLDLQRPLMEQLLARSGPGQGTLVASGDVLILAPHLPRTLPEVDVVCFGIWVDPQLASRHGVFFTPRNDPGQLEFMLQKPTREVIEERGADHLFQMDVGLWILSDRAVQVLMDRCGWDESRQEYRNGHPEEYDLYGTYGLALGRVPTRPDPLVSSLTTAVVPLEGGDFYHFGTSLELITSMGKIQNRVLDQRVIWHNRVKPHPSLFVQNAVTDLVWTDRNHHVWIENSQVGRGWSLTDHHVITGVPENTWNLSLSPGVCLDVVPLPGGNRCLRPYGVWDSFQGDPSDPATLWMGIPVADWLGARGLTLGSAGLSDVRDLQKAPLFPVLDGPELSAAWVAWMLPGGESSSDLAEAWREGPRLSAEQISAGADLSELYRQRDRFRLATLPLLARNQQRSVFFQVDLRALAADFQRGGLALPAPLPPEAPPVQRFSDLMFRAEVTRRTGGDGSVLEEQSFGVLRDALLGSVPLTAQPRRGVHGDQIVWARSPARLDLAGGWSDTPPYCVQSGGRVVNLAVDLNGQPPLQAFVRLAPEPKIVLRSIDNGVSREITEYGQLVDQASLGSAFSIPQAALSLAGFHPRFNPSAPATLREMLGDFGGGLEVSLLSAIPKGSGLGTSSILAATLLGALSDFCQLGWSRQDLGSRTLVLEQILTSGGGWQDQFGGLFPGLKLLETRPGYQESVEVRWLPDRVFTESGSRDHWLLYYTGITRVAKTILGEIVTGMFLNERDRLGVLDDIKAHAADAGEALSKCDLDEVGRVVARSWELNKALDPGTTSPEIEALVARIGDKARGLKLLGAGGGGYLVICAQDPEAARRIRNDLEANPPNDRARFVSMTVSEGGLQISRS